MKAEDQRIVQFWGWFLRTEDEIIARAMQSDYEWLRAELSPRVRGLGDQTQRPFLNWEIGPGVVKEWQFVLSPSVARNALYTERAIERAPYSERWEWLSCKPPKPLDVCFRVVLTSSDNNSLDIDAAMWHYVLKRAPDGMLDILLLADTLPPLREAERARVAHLLLQNILGERAAMRFGAVELIAIADIPAHVPASDLQCLREHFIALTTA